jgi:predicted ribosome quality control (RQC) complex YloA/Tae2 family protein
MQLALYYSKAREETTADISVTQCKYVSRYGRGHPGKVQISHHKSLVIKKDPARLKRLKDR